MWPLDVKRWFVRTLTGFEVSVIGKLTVADSVVTVRHAQGDVLFFALLENVDVIVQEDTE